MVRGSHLLWSKNSIFCIGKSHWILVGCIFMAFIYIGCLCNEKENTLHSECSIIQFNITVYFCTRVYGPTGTECSDAKIIFNMCPLISYSNTYFGVNI